MTGEGCDGMHLLIQAGVDGELTPAEAARVGAHLNGCLACTETQARLLALSGRLRRELPYHPAPDALRAAVQARVAAMSAPEAPQPGRSPAAVPRPWWWGRLPRPRLWAAGPFGAGFALAAGLAFMLMLAPAGGLPDALVASHIRALQPGHLMDVASADQHTVKPWFDGRLDYAPPVKNLRAEGFPLAGGRLDYLDGRPVAALVYQRRQHVIELYVWPDDGRSRRGPAEGSRSGYNFLRWTRDGMAFWAVSDLNAQEVADFVRLWQAG